MKIFRPLAAALLVFALGHVAPAQESSEITSLRTKAAKGNGIAQYNLGLAYAQGRGVAADPLEAFVWLSLARDNGARGRALDTVIGALDKPTLELAQQRLTERKAALTGRPASPAPARPETPAEASGREAPVSPAGPAPAPTDEDPAVATLRAERDALAVRINNLAGDLAELRAERERLAKLAADNERAAQAATEVGRAAEARIAGLVRAGEATQAELAQARSTLANLQQAPKPAPDTAALEAKTRELAAALAELEAAKNFGRQVEDTLNKVNDDRARVAANATAELEAARQFGQQVETTLNRVNDQKAALETQLASAQRALAAKPGYPNLSGRVAELESALAAKPAAPTYPDLSGRVAELETQLATAEKSAAAKPAYPNLTGKVAELEAALAAARISAPAYPDLRSRVTELETQFAALQAAAQERTQELARANTKLAGDESALAAVSRELADAKNSLAQANQALTAKPAAPKYPDLSGRVGELETALAAARTAAPAYPNLTGKVAELEGQLASLQSAAAADAQLKSRLAEREAQVLQLAQEVKRGETGLKQAQESYTALEAEANQLRQRPVAPAYPDLSGRVDELETALADASRQLVATQNVKPAAPAYPDLSGRVAELEAAVATSIQKFGAAEQARAEISRQFDDYKSATAAAQRERTTLQSNLKMLESDKAALRRQVDAASTEANQLRTQVATLKTQAAAIKPPAPTYPDLSGKIAELEAALAAKPAAPAYPDLSGRVAELETALAARPAAPAYPDLSGRVSELEATLATAKQQLAAKPATPGYPNLSGRVAELEAALAAKPAAPTYPDLSGRVSELESALAAARQQPVVPNYPDLSGRVSELEAALVTARNAAPAYPNLADKVAKLETKLAGAEKSTAALSAEAANARQQVAVLTKAQKERPAPPAYPDLSGQVAELSNETTQLRADRERMQRLLDDSGRQLAEATAANRSRPVAPPGYLDRVRELETALAANRQQLAAAQNTPVTPAYPDLSGQVAELEAKLAAAEKPAVEKPAGPAYPDLSGRVSDLTGEVARLRADRERMQKLLADSGRQLRDNTADTARIRELETQLVAAQAQVGGITTERNAARDAQSELRDTIARLEQEKTQLAAAQNSAPAYPDLSARVHELEAQLATAPRSQTAPAYPDLSGRVGELESALAATKQQLAAAQTALAPATGGDTPGLAQKLADTEDRLATALRGYAALQRERDTLAENTAKTAAAVTAERDALASQVASLTGQVEQLRASAQSRTGSTQAELARFNEAVATLQRTSTQASRDAVAARALAQQLQGANAVLAGENYQLKTMLARSTGGPAPAIAPVTAPAARTHVVAAGDSLSRLSQRYYGTAGRWQEIYTANAALLGPNGVLRVGTELHIP